MVNTSNLLFSMYVVSGTLSIIGSSSILVLIYKDRKTKKMDKRNNYMLLAALSFFDIIVSFVLGYGWNFYPDGKHPWAQGNDNTCMGHTFLLTLGLASTYYNASLAVYYVFVVKFGKSAKWMYKWAMPSLVGLPAIYATTMTATCLSVGSYGFDGKFCGWCGWVDNNRALGWAASWGPICFSFALVIICMAVMIYAIYVNEKKMRDRYDFGSRTSSSGDSAQLKMTRKMAIQALLYIGAFFITYVWSFAANFLKAYGSGDVPFFVLVLRAIFQPLQGLLNFCIFYRGYSKGSGGRNGNRVSSTGRTSFFGRISVFGRTSSICRFSKRSATCHSEAGSNSTPYNDVSLTGKVLEPDLEASEMSGAAPNAIGVSFKLSEDVTTESKNHKLEEAAPESLMDQRDRFEDEIAQIKKDGC